MDILVVIALVIGAAVCFLPAIMAWSHYFGGTKRTASKRKVAGTTRPVTTRHAY